MYIDCLAYLTSLFLENAAEIRIHCPHLSEEM